MFVNRVATTHLISGLVPDQIVFALLLLPPPVDKHRVRLLLLRRAAGFEREELRLRVMRGE